MMHFALRGPALLRTFGALGLLVACSREPHARSVIGPDGSPMLHVACGRDQGACFELAGRGCPYGYKVFPIFDRQENNFLIRCHAAPDMASLPQDDTPNVGSSVFARPSSPMGVWSGADASIAVKPPPPTSGTRNDSEIDLGY
jgi:hypothetical protein